MYAKQIMRRPAVRLLALVPVFGILFGMLLAVPQYPLRREDDYQKVLDENEPEPDTE